VNQTPAGELPEPDASELQLIRAAVTLGLFIFASWVMWSYIVAVVWGGLIAIAIWPMYSRLAAPPAVAARPWVAPLFATASALFIIGLPVVLALAEIGRESQSVFEWIKGVQRSGLEVPPWLTHLPLLGSGLDQWWRTHLSDPRGIPGVLEELSPEALPSWMQSVGGELVYRMLLVLLTFMTLFLMLREAESISTRLHALSNQWLGDPGEHLLEIMVEAVRGVVNGTVAVAVAEGFLIGIGYVAAGLPQPYLLAALTIAFAMVPLAAWFVFAAASLFLLVSGGSALATGA
jgi:predicted PurR-regulated permease PerM